VHLTQKQQRFVEEYLVSGNGRRAAIRAGYSAKTADAAASRLLRNVKVSRVLAAGRRDLTVRTGLSQDRVVLELAKIAFGDIGKLFDEHGQPKRLFELSDDIGPAVRSLKASEVRDSTGAVRRRRFSITMHDKHRALALLLKHLSPSQPVEGAGTPEFDEALVGTFTDDELARFRLAIDDVRKIFTAAEVRRRSARALPLRLVGSRNRATRR
jgi:phage terminase small subunit